MLKKIKENKIKWKGLPCSWTRRIDIIKIPLLTKLIYRSTIIPIKMTATFLQRERNVELKRTQITTIIFERTSLRTHIFLV
jgi:hypothetical protein